MKFEIEMLKQTRYVPETMPSADGQTDGKMDQVNPAYSHPQLLWAGL